VDKTIQIPDSLAIVSHVKRLGEGREQVYLGLNHQTTAEIGIWEAIRGSRGKKVDDKDATFVSNQRSGRSKPP